MPGTLTKSDVRFDEVRIYRIRQPDDSFIWYASVGYRVLTTEGEEYRKDRQIELTGTKKTAAKDFLVSIYDQVKTEEGI